MLVLENDLQSPPLRGLVGDEILFKSSMVGPGVSLLEIHKKCYLLKILCCGHMPSFIYHH